MSVKSLPTRDLVRQLLRYAPPHLIWKHRPRAMFPSRWAYLVWNKRYAGSIAGSLHPRGHIIISKAHRLVWLIVRGEPVPNEIDHRDRDRTNNRIGNLRAATHSQNLYNATRRTDNPTGIKGVTYTTRGSAYRASVNSRHIGTFATIEEATAARRAAAELAHGDFVRHE